MPVSKQFPSTRATRLLAVLMRQPLGYSIARQSGSDRRLTSPDYPPLTFAFHCGQELSAGLIRKILVKDVGLTVDQALDVLEG